MKRWVNWCTYFVLVTIINFLEFKLIVCFVFLCVQLSLHSRTLYRCSAKHIRITASKLNLIKRKLKRRERLKSLNLRCRIVKMLASDHLYLRRCCFLRNSLFLYYVNQMLLHQDLKQTSLSEQLGQAKEKVKSKSKSEKDIRWPLVLNFWLVSWLVASWQWNSFILWV